jgi:hypothetical protein
MRVSDLAAMRISTSSRGRSVLAFLVAVFIFLLTVAPPTLNAQDFKPVNIFIPTFQSPKGKSDLGVKITALLGLQIWRTYSRPTRSKSSFDNADIFLQSKDRPKTNAEAEALARLRPKKPDLVLWGRTSEYGNGIVVESNLLIRAAVDTSNLGETFWSVTIPTDKRPYTVSVGLPARQYEFAPIVLSRDLVETFNRFTRWHNSMAIYVLRSTNSEVIGDLRTRSVEAISHDGDWSRVRDQNTSVSGWLYLPRLSENPSEVVNFCSGIVRMLRKDWSGAVGQFQQVVDTDDVPTAIKVDAYLYMAVAYDRLNDEARSFTAVVEAYKLNPYSRSTSKYLFMRHLAGLSEAISQDKRAEVMRIVQTTREMVSKNRILFADNDPWIKDLEMLLAEFGD